MGQCPALLLHAAPTAVGLASNQSLGPGLSKGPWRLRRVLQPLKYLCPAASFGFLKAAARTFSSLHFQQQTVVTKVSHFREILHGWDY